MESVVTDIREEYTHLPTETTYWLLTTLLGIDHTLVTPLLVG